MKKSKKNGQISLLMPYEPDHKAIRKSAAEHMARTMMDTHPKMNAMRNHITKEVQKAAHRAMSGRAKKGTFGY